VSPAGSGLPVVHLLQMTKHLLQMWQYVVLNQARGADR
jgi:hypothetical protein